MKRSAIQTFLNQYQLQISLSIKQGYHNYPLILSMSSLPEFGLYKWQLFLKKPALAKPFMIHNSFLFGISLK
jgi:hypothetical protein